MIRAVSLLRSYINRHTDEKIIGSPANAENISPESTKRVNLTENDNPGDLCELASPEGGK